jgi:hypothetical protein
MTEGTSATRLQDALPVLAEALTLANRQIEEGTPGAIRNGLIRALNAVSVLLNALPAFRQQTLALPFVKLSAALLDLDDGTTAPFLRPPAFANRHPDSMDDAALQGLVAFSVDRLIRVADPGLGDRPNMTVRTAARRVAAELSRHGYEFSGKNADQPEEVIINWREKVRRSRGGRAAKMYQSFSEMDLKFPPGTAPGDQVRELLARMVQVLRTSGLLRPNPE